MITCFLIFSFLTIQRRNTFKKAQQFDQDIQFLLCTNFISQRRNMPKKLQYMLNLFQAFFQTASMNKAYTMKQKYLNQDLVRAVTSQIQLIKGNNQLFHNLRKAENSVSCLVCGLDIVHTAQIPSVKHGTGQGLAGSVKKVWASKVTCCRVTVDFTFLLLYSGNVSIGFSPIFKV